MRGLHVSWPSHRSAHSIEAVRLADEMDRAWELQFGLQLEPASAARRLRVVADGNTKSVQFGASSCDPVQVGLSSESAGTLWSLR